ncbi:MAG: hypothetical protein EOO90_11105 [Pedobacter sp.]|nr:MAG: hypothetical protein EOO90_11105 [Pedobacter sp.]
MSSQLTSNAEALRLFFTEDIYLVQDETVDLLPSEAQKTTLSFKHLGKNQKNILILVNDTENEVSNEAGRELLRKLVKAIDLTANDFALVNYAKYAHAKYSDLYKFFDCKLLLAFGVGTVQLGLPDVVLNHLAKHDGTNLLFTKNLADLDNDQMSKKILWSSLQQLK